MKRYAPLLLTFLFLPLLFSCFDLEEDLYDQLEKEDYYTDYESLMASVLRPYEHAKWAETNFSFWLQELSADQLVITQKREHWEDGGVWRMIHQYTWDTYEKNSKRSTFARCFSRTYPMYVGGSYAIRPRLPNALVFG